MRSSNPVRAEAAAISEGGRARNATGDAAGLFSIVGQESRRQGALYLLRPDTYVALVDPSPDAAALAAYFSDRGLAP